MIDARAHVLFAKHGVIDRVPSPLGYELLEIAVPDRLSRTHLRAPRHEALRAAVIAKVALLHQPRLDVDLGHAERTGIHTVTARDTARRLCLLDNAFGRDQDGHDRTDLGARSHGILAMHTQRWLGGHAEGTVDEVDHDHALALVRIALAAGCLA